MLPQTLLIVTHNTSEPSGPADCYHWAGFLLVLKFQCNDGTDSNETPVADFRDVILSRAFQVVPGVDFNRARRELLERADIAPVGTGSEARFLFYFIRVAALSLYRRRLRTD
jgi:hypothetical protein